MASAIIKPGKYGAVLNKGTLAEAYQRHLSDADYKDLRDELAVMRSFTEAAVLALNGVTLKELSPSQCAVVMTMVGEVRSLVETVARVDQRISLSMSITDLHAVIAQVFEVIKAHVQDVDVLKEICAGLEALTVPTVGSPVAK